MQNAIVFIIWTLFALLFQSVILTDFPSVKIWSDLLFYLVIILGLKFGFTTGVVVAGVLGYIADTASLVPYGTTLISYVLTLMLIRKVRVNIYIENRWSLFFWIIIFSICRQFVQAGCLALSDRGLELSFLSLGRLLLQSGWDALLGILILPFLDKALTTNWSVVFKRKGLKD